MAQSDQLPHPLDSRFGPGPSLVPVQHVDALAATKAGLLGTSHRQKAVKNLVGEVRENLSTFFGLKDTHEVVLGNGGATFLWDMIGLGMTRNKSVHYTCGEFSSKWYKAHSRIPWIEAEEKAVEFGHAQNPEHVEGADLTCATLNETSTGVMITGLPSRKADTLLAIDATSGAGQIPVDMSKVDCYYFSPQKVFAAEGGMFLAIMSQEAIARTEEIAGLNRYNPIIMDWKLAIDNSRKNQTYNTPSISNLFFLNEQLKAMLEFGGEAKAHAYAKEKAEHLYNWAESKDYLSPYIEDPKHRSISVATINLDDRVAAGDITSWLRSEGIAQDIDAYRKLGKNQFRIGMFHNVDLEDLKRLTAIISAKVEESL